MPTRDGDEGDSLGVVTNLLDETVGLLDDFVESVLGPLAGVHLVASNNELPDTEGEGEEGVLSGLTVLGDTGLELTDTGGNDEDGTVSLGGTGDHVLDEVSVTGGVNDSDLVPGGLELPKSNVDGDTSLSLGLKLVKNPSVLERSLKRVRKGSQYYVKIFTHTFRALEPPSRTSQWFACRYHRTCRSSDRWWSTYRSRRDR